MRFIILICLATLISGCQTTGRGVTYTERVQIDPKTSASVKMVGGRATVRGQVNGLGNTTLFLNADTLIKIFKP